MKEMNLKDGRPSNAVNLRGKLNTKVANIAANIAVKSSNQKGRKLASMDK